MICFVAIIERKKGFKHLTIGHVLTKVQKTQLHSSFKDAGSKTKSAAWPIINFNDHMQAVAAAKQKLSFAKAIYFHNWKEKKLDLGLQM